jgi:hypothetical protein
MEERQQRLLDLDDDDDDDGLMRRVIMPGRELIQFRPPGVQP